MHTTDRTLPRIFLALVLALALVMPYVGHAQDTDPQLRATVRGMLLSDPRTSGLTAAQIDTMVTIMTQEAEKQGITVQDLQWRPKSAERFVPGEQGALGSVECVGGFLCTMTEAFGFVGVDQTIPFTLGAASMGLVWILAEMLHRRRHPYIPAAPSSGM